MNNDTMTHRCVVCGEDITLKTNGHGRCNNCEAHVKILDYGGDDNMDDANRMTNSIEKLSVLRMMSMDFEELLGHADEVSAYNEEVQRGLRRKAYAEGVEEGRKVGRRESAGYLEKKVTQLNGKE